MDRKQAWESNYSKIKQAFPSTGEGWDSSVNLDLDAFASVLGDVIKAEGKRSRPGKRPSLSRAAAEDEYIKISGGSYSEVEFTRAFRALTHGRSVRGIANKVDIGQTVIHRLLHGGQPTFEHMEKIAKAYKKDPSYFLEYRIAYSLMAIEKFLMDSPETATVWYLKMRGRGSIKIK